MTADVALAVARILPYAAERVRRVVRHHKGVKTGAEDVSESLIHEPPDTVGELISRPKADLSARDFPSSLCPKKLYMG
jgi:hypothetical protein